MIDLCFSNKGYIIIYILLLIFRILPVFIYFCCFLPFNLQFSPGYECFQDDRSGKTIYYFQSITTFRIKWYYQCIKWFRYEDPTSLLKCRYNTPVNMSTKDAPGKNSPVTKAVSGYFIDFWWKHINNFYQNIGRKFLT